MKIDSKDWTLENLRAAVLAGTTEEKVELLRELGILDENGNLSKKYTDWGDKVSMTMTKFDEEE